MWRFWTESDKSADKQWARRQAAEAQNHIFDRYSVYLIICQCGLTFDRSLGERYGLRIIPGSNSFLVLPNNISRSSAVGAIMHPGGPAHSVHAIRAAWLSPDVPDPEPSTDVDFILAVGKDEKLMRRLNELEGAETVSTGAKGTDAKWRLAPEEIVPALRKFIEAK